MLSLLFLIRSVRIHSLLYLCFGLLALPFLTGFGPPQLVDRIYVPTQRVKVGDPQPLAVARQLPALSAEAYLLYDLDANQLLLSHNVHAALPPASLTKLMTALLVLEQADLTAQVTIERSDLVGGATMALRAGEMLTVEQLLWGMLIPSGNDAATALARHVAGSSKAFVELMNQRAQALGLAASHFVNPHGLDVGGHTSSAADLLLLTQLLWRYPLFRQIVAVATTEIAGHQLRTTNELLGQDSRINGIKTGTTDRAGQCLVAGLQQNGRQVFIIVLNSRDRYADAQALYSYYTANYAWFDGQQAELTALNRLYGGDGKTWYLRPQGKPTAWLLRREDLVRLRSFHRLHLPSSDQPWQPGMPVGVLEWWLDDRLVGSQPLIFW